MKHKLKRLLALAGVGALLATSSVAVGSAASAAEGVIVVTSRDQALPGTVWTDGVPDPETCLVTDTGVHTAPGESHEAEYESRAAYSQVVPGQAEQSHTEYQYQRTVKDYKTQYHFAKFTREKTKSADVRGYWQEFSPTKPKTFQGPPTHPTDPRGKWSEPKYSGGPDKDKSGVFQNGGGNGSWFFRAQAVPGTWSDFGPWTKWLPEQHTSWQDSDVPLGTPQVHAQSANYYREWQARFDGQTRQVETGSHVETSEWLTAPPAGDGWVQIGSKKVVTQEQTDDKTVYFLAGGEPTDTLTDANYTTEIPGEPWVKVGEKDFETKAAYTDPDVVTLYSHTHEAEDCGTPPTNVICDTYVNGPVGTDTNGLWTNVDTRSAGHYEYVEGGLRIWTDDNSSQAKVSLGTAVTIPGTQLGQLAVDWTGTNPGPGINLFTDFDGNGSIDGTLVYETVYGQDLWLTNGSAQFVKDGAPVNGGGNGSQWHGTINQWLEEFPEFEVKGIAFSYGSGIFGEGVLNSLTVGCTVYTFDKADVVPPQPEDKVTETEFSEPVITCDNKVGDEITITKYVTTTPYILVQGEWVLDTENAETVPVNDVYIVTEADIEALDCPVVTPPTEEPPVTEPPTKAPPATEPPAPAFFGPLAQTGSEILPWILAGTFLTAAGLLIAFRKKLLALIPSRKAE